MSELIWMPHPGHFICAERCNFRLNTYVNGYIVSTVGEMFKDFYGPTFKWYGDEKEDSRFAEIGAGRLYETMVFRAEKSNRKCCPYEAIVEGGELDFAGYNTADEAAEGHGKMIEKWSLK